MEALLGEAMRRMMISEFVRRIAFYGSEEESGGPHYMDEFLKVDPDSEANLPAMCCLLKREALRFMSEFRFNKEFGCVNNEKRIASVAKYFRWTPIEENTLKSKILL